ncbi:Disease resistance protein RPP4 [Bienertia sinuspersici]
MRALAWNCRGVNSENSLAIPYVRRKGTFGVDAINQSGGLFLACFATNLEVKLVECTRNFIFCKIVDGLLFYFACFLYGNPNLEGRGEVWETLKNLFASNPGPTILLGDFNQTEFADQKLGGRKYLPGARAFSDWRISSGLIDLPTRGPAFTWCNNRETSDLIFEQLDRAYSNEDLDHGAILLETTPKNTKRKRPYKLEAWCLEKDEVKEIIKQEWATKTKGSSMFRAMRKQAAVSAACRNWCLNRKKELGITWDKFEEELIETREEPRKGWFGVNEVKKRKQCQEKAKDQLMYWKQRAKIKWDLLGDQCTNFFFRSVKTRKGEKHYHTPKKGGWHLVT